MPPVGDMSITFLPPALGAILMMLTVVPGSARAQDRGQIPQRVEFMSADGRTRLVGYLYRPQTRAAVRAPAVVMMHGRAGAYSSLAKGVYNASTLSLRHKAWGRIWADAGYLAILVDGFGPRGYPKGFPRLSYDSRPETLNEVTVRPLDAYGALHYLRSRSDVIADRVALQGWSNGGSATIATMAPNAPGIRAPSPHTGFRAALAFYPACGLKGLFDDKPFRPYAPVLVLHGTADEEVSYSRCRNLVDKGRASGGGVEIKIYPGTTHDFDSPAGSRRSVQANASATEDATVRSRAFFARHFGLPGR